MRAIDGISEQIVSGVTRVAVGETAIEVGVPIKGVVVSGVGGPVTLQRIDVSSFAVWNEGMERDVAWIAVVS